MQFIKNTIVCIRHRHTSAILCKRKNAHVGKSSLTTDWLSLRVHYYIRKYTDAVDVTRWQVYTLRRDRAFQRVKTRGSPLLLPNSFFFFLSTTTLLRSVLRTPAFATAKTSISSSIPYAKNTRLFISFDKHFPREPGKHATRERVIVTVDLVLRQPVLRPT